MIILTVAFHCGRQKCHLQSFRWVCGMVFAPKEGIHRRVEVLLIIYIYLAKLVKEWCRFMYYMCVQVCSTPCPFAVFCMYITGVITCRCRQLESLPSLPQEPSLDLFDARLSCPRPGACRAMCSRNVNIFKHTDRRHSSMSNIYIQCLNQC